MEQTKEGLPQLPQISCLRLNKATMVCASKHCKQNAFMCSKQDCQNCQGKHETCMRYKVDSLISQIAKKKQTITPEVKKAIQALEKIYDQAIEKLSIEKELMSAKVQLFGLNDYQINLVRKLQDGLSNQVKGKLVLNVIKNLKTKKQFQATDQSITKFWKKRQASFDQLFDRLKIVTYKKPNFLQSEIVDDMQVIGNFFDQPVISSDLLYRASQNNFSVEAFHRKCDGVKNTLIVLKTEYGYIAGGFTPLAWGSNGSYQRDDDKKTFIFSVTNKQKYKLTMPQYTIYCSSGYGPTFGGGHDLYIANGSDTNRSSYFNVPHSYNVDNSIVQVKVRQKRKALSQSGSDSEWQDVQEEIQSVQQQQQQQSSVQQQKTQAPKQKKKKKSQPKQSKELNPRNFIGSTSDYYAKVVQWQVFKLEF